MTIVSDVGGWNDSPSSDVARKRSIYFNRLQLKGALRARRDLGITLLPRESNAVADYVPNLTTGVRNGSQLVMATGFPLAKATATVAKRFPNTQFAVMDYGVNVPPFTGNRNVTGLVFPTEQGGCLAGYMAGLMLKTRWADKPQVIGAVGGIKIPAVDAFIAGYRYCARLANAKVTVLIGYSQDFVTADRCRAVAQDQIAKGAQIIFQVAGRCGLGTLKAADDAGIWGIGVDKEQSGEARRVMTSVLKRVDVATYLTIKAAVDGTPLGGTNLTFTLKNGGQALGRTNPVVPKSVRARVAKIRRRIIAGQLTPPAKLSLR